MGRVTEDWGPPNGLYPVFDTTPVADSFTFGTNNEFGTEVDASGFYGGISDDDSGFDPDQRITNIVTGWHDGIHPNHGIRIAFDTPALVGAAFAESNLPGTPEDESLKLLVTYVSVQNKAADQDPLNDDYELATFGNLAQSGSEDFDGDGTTNLEEWALGGQAATSGQFPAFGIVSNGSNDPNFSFHRILEAGLGFEVELSEDFANWSPFTKYYRYQEPAPASELGANFDKVTLEPIGPLPETLCYRVKIQAGNSP